MPREISRGIFYSVRACGIYFAAARARSCFEIQIAQVASPVMFRVVRPMSKILSTPAIRAMPSTGIPTALSTIESMIIPAPDTPAVPMEASVAVRTTMANL